MSDFEIRVHTEAFRTWLHRASDDFVRIAQREMKHGVAISAKAARETREFKDGPNEDRKGPHLRNTIVKGQKAPWRWFIKATAKHAKYLEDGTRDSVNRTIAKGRALVFRWHGVLMFRKTIAHKGMKATHFLAKAAQAGEQYFDYYMEDAIARAFR